MVLFVGTPYYRTNQRYMPTEKCEYKPDTRLGTCRDRGLRPLSCKQYFVVSPETERWQPCVRTNS